MGGEPQANEPGGGTLGTRERLENGAGSGSGPRFPVGAATSARPHTEAERWQQKT